MTTSDSAHSQTDKLVSGAEEDGGGEKQPDTYAYGVKLVGNGTLIAIQGFGAREDEHSSNIS